MRLLGTVLLLAVSLPSVAVAQGAQDHLDFQGRSSLVAGSGARAFGMGGAFLARADDATASSWNPAGLSYLRRPEISVVLRRAAVNTTRRSLGGNVTLEDDGFGNAVDFLAVASPVSLGSGLGSVQISFQRTVSFRGERHIDEPDQARRLSGKGGFDVLALGTGLQVTRKVRVGATVNRWFNGYHQTLHRVVRPSVQETDFDLSGWNANVGLIWSPLEPLNMGLVAKSAFTGDVVLTRSRTDYFSDVITSPNQVTTNQHTSEDVRLDLPAAVGIGLSWRPRSTVTLSADYTRTFWSRARIRNFFVLLRTEQDNLPTLPTVFADLPYPGLDAAAQNDTSQSRAGLEYVLIGDRVTVPLRVGVFTDRQHFRPADGQPPRFYGFTVGTGIVRGRVLFDVAYVQERGGFDLDGRNRVRIHQLLTSLIFRRGEVVP